MTRSHRAVLGPLSRGETLKLVLDDADIHACYWKIGKKTIGREVIRDLQAFGYLTWVGRSLRITKAGIEACKDGRKNNRGTTGRPTQFGEKKERYSVTGLAKNKERVKEFARELDRETSKVAQVNG